MSNFYKQTFIVSTKKQTNVSLVGRLQDLVNDFCEGARKVLTSGNPIAFDALERNIRYFSHAIDVEKRMAGVEADLAEMKRYIIEMKKQEEERERACKEEPLPGQKAA